MYLGFVLMLIGVWILLGDLASLLGVLLFVVAAERWYIPFEEQRMLAKFGSEYTAYQNKTRRWI